MTINSHLSRPTFLVRYETFPLLVGSDERGFVVLRSSMPFASEARLAVLEYKTKHLKALSYVQPNIRRPRELSPEKNGCYLEQSWGKDFWTKSVSGESAPGGPYAGAGHHNVTTTPIPGGGLEMKFTISEAEITLARSFLEALLGGLLTASSSRNLGPPPGLGPASEPSPGTPAWPPPPHPPTA